MTKIFHGLHIYEEDSGPAPIKINGTSVIGIIGEAPDAKSTKWPLNTPFLITKSPDDLKSDETLGDTGSLVTGLRAIFETCPTFVVAIRVENAEAVPAAVKLFEKAGSIAKMVPKILCTNGYTKKVVSQVSNALSSLDVDDDLSEESNETEKSLTADPVAVAFSNTAEKIRAIVVCDVPVGSNDSDSSGHTLSNVDDFFTGISNKRVYPIWGGTISVNSSLSSKKSGPVSVASSVIVAATICKNDIQRAWSRSPSNMPIKTILGVNHPVSFSLTDPLCEADQLNKKGVACIVNYKGEFRLWGNCGLGVHTDKKWQFINIVRTYDIMVDALIESSMWAMDQGITSTYVEDVAVSQNIFYSKLKREGHITEAKCTPGEGTGTPDEIASGNVYWNIYWCGVYPANQMNYKTRMETEYLKDIFNA